MSREIILGHSDGDTALVVNIDRLIETRLLIQANSGAGKSWAIRRLLEQTQGAAQQIVIDMEGEFHTLREKYDYVLARPHEGDCLAHPRVAKLLAIRLLELGISAIIDIYELKAHERHAFVRLFLEALVNAPKKLWHPALIIVDEAHVFCPQSTKAEGAGAVIDLMARGRKRGFCGVLATQRISKLHKDAAAEANNKLIGRSALDVDMKRAADELGFTSRDEQLRLRTLRAGEFYAFGPALSDVVTKIKVGPVETTHPRLGHRAGTPPPPPSEKVKAILAQLSELSKEAETEARTIGELSAKVRGLQAELRRRPTTAPNEAQLAAARLEGEQHFARAHRATARELSRAHEGIIREVEQLRKHLEAVTLRSINLGQIARKAHALAGTEPTAPDRSSSAPAASHTAHAAKPPERIVVVPRQEFGKPRPSTQRDGHDGLPGPYRRILNAIAWFDTIGIKDPSKIQVAFVAGYAAGSGAVNNYFGAMRTIGLVDYPIPGAVALTEKGHGRAEWPEAPASTEALHDAVLGKLSGPHRRILRVLLESYPTPIDKGELATRADYAPGTGAFNNYVGKLRSLGLIDYPVPGQAVALPIMFLEDG